MISFSTKLKFVPGIIKGLQQSSIAGSIRIDKSEEIPRDKLVSLFSQISNSSVETDTSIEEDQDWLAATLLEWAIKIQHSNQIIISKKYFLEMASNEGNGARVFRYVFPYSIPIEATSKCFDWIKYLVAETLSLKENDLSPALVERAGKKYLELKEALNKYVAPSVNRFYLADAAFELGIPIRPMKFDVYVLGLGSKSRLFSSSITDGTSAIGVRIAKDKSYSSELLQAAGLPAPPQAKVTNAEEALAIAEKIGYPMVIKPVDEDEGRGVSADLCDSEQVTLAYNQARNFTDKIIAEKHIEGFTHRITVLNNKIIKVAKRIAGGVVGDGQSSIKDLIDQKTANSSLPTVVGRHGSGLVGLDEEAQGLLKQYNLEDSYVPASGEYIRLRRRDNFSAGGTNENIEVESLHEDNKTLALRVASLFRLDFIGIDLVIDDISNSWISSGGAICEVNAQPTLGISYAPFLYHDILRDSFPNGSSMPVHLGIVSADVELELEKLFQLQRELNAAWLSTVNGLYFGDSQMSGSYQNYFLAAKSVLINNDVDSALCITTALDIIEFGAPCSQIDSVSVINEDSFSDKEKGMLQDALDLIGRNFEQKQV